MNTIPTKKYFSLLRHAKSDWEKPGLDDHDRPLNARGRRSVPLIADYIKSQRIEFDVILVSTALRTQQTLDLLIEASPGRAPTVFSTQNLYLAAPRTILEEVAKLDEQWNSVLVIGHNPGLGDLASQLAEKWLEYPTACLSVFSVDANSWSDFASSGFPAAQLTHYCRPRQLE